MELEPTATHLPVLDELLRAREPKTVLEFGCGLYSTPTFVSHGCKVTCIEMQHRSWVDRMLEITPEASIILAIGPDTWKKFEHCLLPRYDLIFVDGHGDSRPECLTWAKDRADLIVAHDTEHSHYGWERADMSEFHETVYRDLTPWTTVWERK